MKGVNVKRIVWTAIFLGITLVAIVMEVIAGVWHPAGTIPWTEYIAQYVPWPIQLAAYVVLAVWLPFHFWRADHKRKAAYREGYEDARDHAPRPYSTVHLDLTPDEVLVEAARRRGWTVDRGR